MANPQPPSSSSPPTFRSLYHHLLNQTPHPFLFCSPRPHSTALTPTIASLSLHPTLEVILHILNHDLTSAHFLLRHMQCPPKYEGMFLHGILHRVEGDFENARAWYEQVEGTEVFCAVWEGGGEEPGRFVDACEEVKGMKNRGEGEGKREEVQAMARGELERVVSFCVSRFGEGRWEDVCGEWVRMSEEKRKQAESMAIGGEGWRQF